MKIVYYPDIPLKAIELKYGTTSKNVAKVMFLLGALDQGMI